MGSSYLTLTMELPVDSVCCLLCQAVITYQENDAREFTKHMNIEHNVDKNEDFLLVACLMEKEEREAVQTVIEAKQVEDINKDAVDNNTYKESSLMLNIKKEFFVNLACDGCELKFESNLELEKHKV